MYRPRKKMRLWVPPPSSPQNASSSREMSVAQEDQCRVVGTVVDESDPENETGNIENGEPEHFSSSGSRAGDLDELELQSEFQQNLNHGQSINDRSSTDILHTSHNTPEELSDTSFDQRLTMDWQDVNPESPPALGLGDGVGDETEYRNGQSSTIDWRNSNSWSPSTSSRDYESYNEGESLPFGNEVKGTGKIPSALSENNEYDEMTDSSDYAYYASTASSSPKEIEKTNVAFDQFASMSEIGDDLKDVESVTEWDSQLASLLLFFRNSNDSPQVTCFGMLCNSKAKVFHALPSVNMAPRLDSIDGLEIQLRIEENAVLLRIIGIKEVYDFAVVNEDTSKVLKALLSLESCFVKTFVLRDAATAYSEGVWKRHQNSILLFDIVIYGASAIKDSVSRILSSFRLYLQHPIVQEPNTLYDNPHFLKEEDIVTTSGGSLHITKLDRSNHESDAEESLLPANDTLNGSSLALRNLPRVARVLNSLTRFKSLKRLEADAKITTPLKQYNLINPYRGSSADVRHRHQEEALDFMSQRESDFSSGEYSLWTTLKEGDRTFYEHKITGNRNENPPHENVGGILADEMGLGKTLTTLAFVIRSSIAAASFAAPGNGQAHFGAENTSQSVVCSRATFVIVPNSTVMEVWIREVDMRCAGSLVTNVYHGRGRDVDPRHLADSDIVLSTFHTVATEAMDMDSPLKCIQWYRIVLDEAHTIREMKTKLYQSVSKFSAQYRWCLTGTPIQNGVEDLAALVCFVRSPHLDSMTEFRKHIIHPMAKETGDGINNLRILLESICLRRTNKLLSLPRVVKEDRFVDFSPVERELYIKTQSDMVAAAKMHDSRDRNSKNYFGVFQLQLQLRRLCNHGTFQRSLTGASLEDTRFEQRQLFNLLSDTGTRACFMCQGAIETVGSTHCSNSGIFTPCGHLLCLRCLPQYQADALRGHPTAIGSCPLCRQIISSQYDESKWIESAELPPESTNYRGNMDGNCVSSKIEALIYDIRNEPNQGKSIVFSCWTRSLDLAAQFLTAAEVKFVRIDGTCTASQRQKILDDFDVESDVRILLMTTGTGAIGLNLTVVNRVFILEPQWNPMVENQAIGRVLRMGQGRSVKVVRFVVKGTIEEGVRSQQWRKLGFAKMGWSEATLDTDRVDLQA